MNSKKKPKPKPNRMTKRERDALDVATRRDSVVDLIDKSIIGLPDNLARDLLESLREDLDLRYYEFESYYGR